MNEMYNGDHVFTFADRRKNGRKGPYAKTFTLEEISLIYKYYSCCYGAIYDDNDSFPFIIRHARMTFFNKYYQVEQFCIQDVPSLEENRQNITYFCGHNKHYGFDSNCNAYLNDLSMQSDKLKMHSIIKENDQLKAYSTPVKILNELPYVSLQSRV